MSTDVQLVIPMTGVGQRFINAGFQNLKPLIKTELGTMIENVLQGFQSIQSPLCIISETSQDKSDLIGEIRRVRPHARIVEISPHKRGPSYAIWVAREHINPEKPVIVSYCDFSGIWSEVEFLKEIYLSDGLIQTYTGFHPHMIRSNQFAYVKKNTKEEVIDIQEKRSYTSNPMVEEASSGTYGFRSGQLLIDAINFQIQNEISLNGEFYTSLTYKSLIFQNKKIRTISMERFFQWGTPEDLRDFNFWFRLSRGVLPSTLVTNKASAIILAAGRGSRVAAIAQEEKPFIDVFGKPMWSYTLGFKCVVSPIETGSQAESALCALQFVQKQNSLVHILACDNLLLGEELTELENMLSDFDVIAWVTSDYAPSIYQKNQYSWVKVTSDGKILKLSVKDADPNSNDRLLIGNFSFRSAAIAKKLIDEMLKVRSESTQEAYLEWIIEIALKSGHRVGTIEVKDFWAIGTRSEYKTLQYWSETVTKGTVKR
jgi:dTDP-glucose pyrophosphorylase